MLGAFGCPLSADSARRPYRLRARLIVQGRVDPV
jgi:hypothetical protein